MTELRKVLARPLVVSPTWRRAIGVTAFALATALGAKIALPIPGTPVPFTFGPLFVLLAGALLGARLGAASQTLYLAMGVAGLPVFAMGGGAAYLFGPTGGYLIAYPAAAFVAGCLASGGAARMLAGLVAALGVIYVGGLSGLAVFGSLTTAVALGVTPFLLADLVKALIVLLVARRTKRRALELFGS
jgi:biotin transport system substrate-specific component